MTFIFTSPRHLIFKPFPSKYLSYIDILVWFTHFLMYKKPHAFSLSLEWFVSLRNMSHYACKMGCDGCMEKEISIPCVFFLLIDDISICSTTTSNTLTCAIYTSPTLVIVFMGMQQRVGGKKSGTVSKTIIYKINGNNHVWYSGQSDEQWVLPYAFTQL